MQTNSFLSDAVLQFTQHFYWPHWAGAWTVLTIPLAISILLDLQIHRSLFQSALRASLQLLFIALLFTPLFQLPWYYHLVFLVAMILLGAWIAGEKKQSMPGRFKLAVFALSLSFLVIFSLMLLSANKNLSANIIIPLAGMVIGTASRTISLCFHLMPKSFDEHREYIESSMLEGLSTARALKRPMRSCLKTALLPRIDALKTLGVVHIPGAMAGMLIEGSAVLKAAGYQLLIFFSIIAMSTLAALIATHSGYRLLFVRRYPHLRENK